MGQIHDLYNIIISQYFLENSMLSYTLVAQLIPELACCDRLLTNVSTAPLLSNKPD